MAFRRGRKLFLADDGGGEFWRNGFNAIFAQQRKVLRGMIIDEAPIIFTEDEIEAPVEPVFDVRVIP